MFAEQPSVKLCCQLCCGVFKDPVITTCGVSCPPGLCAPGAPNLGAPGLAAQHVPSAVGEGWGPCGRAPTCPLSPQHTFCRRCALKSGRTLSAQAWPPRFPVVGRSLWGGPPGAQL